MLRGGMALAALALVSGCALIDAGRKSGQSSDAATTGGDTANIGADEAM